MGKVRHLALGLLAAVALIYFSAGNAQAAGEPQPSVNQILFVPQFQVVRGIDQIRPWDKFELLPDGGSWADFRPGGKFSSFSYDLQVLVDGEAAYSPLGFDSHVVFTSASHSLPLFVVPEDSRHTCPGNPTTNYPKSKGCSLTVRVSKFSGNTLVGTTNLTISSALPNYGNNQAVINGNRVGGQQLTVTPCDSASSKTRWYRVEASSETNLQIGGCSYTLLGSESGTIAVDTLEQNGIFQTDHVRVFAAPTPTPNPSPTPSDFVTSGARITGSTISGSTATCDVGSWSPSIVPTIGWSLDGVAIPGATSLDFQLTTAHIGKALSCSATGAMAGYNSKTVTSAGVLVQGYVNTPAPVISGSATVGTTLVASVAAWDSNVSRTFQWQRDGFPISGAIETTYKLKTDDNGHTITLLLTGIAPGLPAISRTSNSIGVGLGNMSLSPIPRVQGTGEMGSTLSVQTGTWDSGVTLAFQWFRDDSPIVGSTGASYQVSSGDVGHAVSVSVTGTLSGYATVTRSSAKFQVAPLGEMTLKPTYAIGDYAVAGEIVQAQRGVWDDGVGLEFQWLRNGMPILGEQQIYYTPSQNDIDQTIQLKVIARKKGFTDFVRYSNAVKVFAVKPIDVPTQPKPATESKALIILRENPKSLNAETVKMLTPEEVKLADPKQLALVPWASFAAVSASQAKQLSAVQIKALNTLQLASLPVVAIKAIAPKTFSALSTKSLAALTRAQSLAVTTSQLKSLTAAQRKALGR